MSRLWIGLGMAAALGVGIVIGQFTGKTAQAADPGSHCGCAQGPCVAIQVPRLKDSDPYVIIYDTRSGAVVTKVR